MNTSQNAPGLENSSTSLRKTAHTPRVAAGRHPAILALALSAVSIAACSSIPPPREQMAVTKAAVERAGGPAGSEAAVELSLARDKLERANLAMGREDYLEARRLAEEAESDANFAEAKARSVRAAGALQEVRESIRMLRDEMSRRVRS